MLARQLGRLGYEVVEAENGREALAYVEREARLDLLLSDVDMPGMDGPTLADKIRQRRPTTPVVFMTGFDAPDVAERVLLKPFPVEDLADAVSTALDGG
jgi:CheY-like chemotaxis protein